MLDINLKFFAEDIYNEVIKELENNPAYKEYGTSQNEGMGHQYKKTIENRVGVLYKAIKMNLRKNNLEDTVTREDLKTYYETTKEDDDWPEFDFNEDYENKIFTILDFENENSISVRDFIRKTIIYEEKLKINKNIYQNAYENTKSKLEHATNQVEKYTELYQRQDKDIVLGVVLCEASKIAGGKPGSQYYVRLIVEDHDQNSAAFPMDQKGNIVFNKTFRFQLKERNQKLKLILMNNGFGGSAVGEVEIDLEDLSFEQASVERTFNLYSNSQTQNNVKGKLRCSLHYVYDTLEYYQNLEDKNKKSLDDLNNNLNPYNSFYQYFSKPFGIWMIGELKTIKQANLQNPLDFFRTSVGGDNLFGRATILRDKGNLRSSSGNIDIAGRFSVENIGETGKNLVKNNKFLVAMILLFGVFSVFNNTIRYDLINFTAFAVTAIFYFFENLERNRGLVNIILGALIAGEVFDLIWVFSSYKQFWNNENMEPFDSVMKKIIYIISIFNFVIKGIIAFSVYHNNAK